MNEYKVTDTELISVANAIRTKGGTSASLPWPDGFVSAISDISSGIIPSGSLSISANGTYDVASFANAVVDVPTGGGGSNDNFLIAVGASVGSIYDTEASVVGDYAFNSASTITDITMTSVSSIGQGAFSRCQSLKTASFPACVEIGTSAFFSCSQLTDISFPACTTVGKGAFYSCLSLISADFPVCTTIGEAGFSSCRSLITASFPACTTIGAYAFYSCLSLISADFPVCTTIGGSAFYYCNQLTTASFPACTTIGGTAFQRCSMLTSVYLLNSSVASLLNGNAFSSSPISTSAYLGYFGSIYVPASLVDAYKSATNWSAYSDRITAYIE